MQTEHDPRPSGAPETTKTEGLRSASARSKEARTPGPWTLGATFRTHNAPERFWETYVFAPGGSVCAAHGATQDEAEANARVLAAADSMLIALRQIRKTCPADSDITREFNAAWGLLEAAIAKAEGK